MRMHLEEEPNLPCEVTASVVNAIYMSESTNVNMTSENSLPWQHISRQKSLHSAPTAVNGRCVCSRPAKQTTENGAKLQMIKVETEMSSALGLNLLDKCLARWLRVVTVYPKTDWHMCSTMVRCLPGWQQLECMVCRGNPYECVNRAL